MSAPALPRPDLQGVLDRADAAYTLAVQHASRTNDWSGVQPAAHAVHQARAALKETEDHQ